MSSICRVHGFNQSKGELFPFPHHLGPNVLFDMDLERKGIWLIWVQQLGSRPKFCLYTTGPTLTLFSLIHFSIVVALPLPHSTLPCQWWLQCYVIPTRVHWWTEMRRFHPEHLGTPLCCWWQVRWSLLYPERTSRCNANTKLSVTSGIVLDNKICKVTL